eukprot:1244443-Ditylum_brightwellii.AAC.1
MQKTTPWAARGWMLCNTVHSGYIETNHHISYYLPCPNTKLLHLPEVTVTMAPHMSALLDESNCNQDGLCKR